MDDKELEQRLSRMKTSWGQVFQANQGREAVSSAQWVLMERSCGAVYRYLLGILRDPDLADDLSQDFALRFLCGDFRQVDPRRGRFRDFLKTALRHPAIDGHRRRQALERRGRRR